MRSDVVGKCDSIVVLSPTSVIWRSSNASILFITPSITALGALSPPIASTAILMHAPPL
ncbi:hypothetical protein BAGQ_1721 [Bacillus velezensis]|nr:hypothetical protein BCBMB205_16210 [Bacillus velezensis]ARZ57955.1 hypothetical protein BAGQ_1721 [Bacillus velezensis]